MTRYIVFILTLIHIQPSFGQDYMSYGRDFLMNSFEEAGFDTVPESENLLIDSSNVVILKFNANYCSRVEYHLTGEEFGDYCDSIFFISSCLVCFEKTKTDFLSNNSRKWKELNTNEFVSIRNKGKHILFVPPREVRYVVLKVKITEATENSNPKLFMYWVEVSKSELKSLKKIKPYQKQ